jgi:phage head maturation protease
VRQGGIDGLSIGFRTVKGRIDPRTRIRKLDIVDLWEISIVTFPLLAGARVHAVQQATSQGKLSHARTRAEREWQSINGKASIRRPEVPAAKAASLEGRRPSSVEARFAPAR